MSIDPSPPDPEARALSARLVEHMVVQVRQSGGFLPFDAFMDAVLYTPGLGYYSNGLTPFGERGDFITAPESGDLFARCMARSFAPVLQQPGQASVLELGAGSGVFTMAKCANPVSVCQATPCRYRIPTCTLQRQNVYAHWPAITAGKVITGLNIAPRWPTG